MTTLTEFLPTRFAEEVARICEARRPLTEDERFRLADLRAKSQIVESAAFAQRSLERNRGPATDAVNGHVIAFREVVRLLAQPYADHPDFDPAWVLTS